jgi:hypothetical protein
MAKGQKRSNREARKPKQNKAPKADVPLGSQVKNATDRRATGAKGKG